jgi:hypothetical protein
MKKLEKTKFEQFLFALILTFDQGITPFNFAVKINVTNIARYAHKLKSLGVNLKTVPLYKLNSPHDIKLAVEILNIYRAKRGLNPTSRDIIIGGFE